MTEALAIALALAVAPATHPTEPPREGVDALCLEVARTAAPALAGSSGVALELSAEGAALDLAEAAKGRCATALDAVPRASLAHDRIVRIRLRVSAPVLVAMVEVLGQPVDGTRPVLLAQPVQVPLGNVLGTWVAAGGTGLETWLVGALDGEVLAACGDDGDGDGLPEVAFLTTRGLEVMRWTTSGLDALAHLDLPPALVPHARAPGASIACRAEDGGLSIAFGIHDRNKGALVRVKNGNAGPLTMLDGIPFGFPVAGDPPLAQGVEGTGLVRWSGRDFSSIALAPGQKGPPWRVVGATQDGAALNGEVLGKPLSVGAAVAVADLDRDGTLEVVRPLPLLPGSDQPDRLLVAPLEEPGAVRHESTAVKAPLRVLGTVATNASARVLAIASGHDGSQVYAFGRRLEVAGR